MTRVKAAACRLQRVAAGLKFPEGPIAMADGSIVRVQIRAGSLSRIEPGGRREVIAAPGGGPDGAAIGPDGAASMYATGTGRTTR
jgi:gluconolactonase